MINMSNCDVLDYLNRFIRCKDISVEKACESKIVQLVCEQIDKKQNQTNPNTNDIVSNANRIS